jgi:4-hydroxybenzoate polyprenyltransferase
MNLIDKVRVLFKLVKFPHTVFALPFALTSAVVAADGLPPLGTLTWILVAMVSARTAAMAFNRLVDADIDAQNPRTADRALPRGLVRRSEVAGLTTAAAVVFVFAASRLNTLCFALSPLALLVILGYSYLKRFTQWTHLFLGVALAIAPVGAWIAVQGRFGLFPVVLGVAVVLWVAGFDIIYACQDAEFDARHRLSSFPQRYGLPNALKLSALFHIGAATALISLVWFPSLGPLYLVGVLIVAALLLYEHTLVKPHDLSKADSAFFTMNGVISILFMCFAIADVFVPR